MLKNFIHKNKVLIAAHRGTWGGNIIQNTIPAFENAIKQGSDIIEIDVIKSSDNKFFVFHSGQEYGVFGKKFNLSDLTSDEILNQTLINSMQEEVNQKINTLDEVLEHFKGKCLINVDRSWFYWDDIIKTLNKHNMLDQIIIKSAPEEQYLKTLSELGPEIMYMPIVKNKDQIQLVEKYNLNFVAAELIFEDESNPLIEDSFMDSLHKKNLLLWVNSITLNDKTILSARRDDNCSILKSEDEGFGWLIDKKFDIIQTDWPLLLKNYILKNHI